jgi:hypothetical protein
MQLSPGAGFTEIRKNRSIAVTSAGALCKTAYSPSKINFPGMVADILKFNPLLNM